MSTAGGTLRGSGNVVLRLPVGFYVIWGTVLFACVIIIGLLFHQIAAERDRLIEGYKGSARALHATLLSGLEDQFSRLNLLMQLARDQRIDWNVLIAQDSANAPRRSALMAADTQGRRGALAPQSPAFLQSVLLFNGGPDDVRQYGLQLAPAELETLARGCSAISGTSAPEMDPKLFVLDPLHMAQDDRWLLPLAQIRSRNGGCRADLALLDTDYLNRMLERLDVDFASISTSSGAIIARHPDAEQITGQHWTDRVDVWRYQDRLAQTGLITSPIDGKVRIAAYGAATTPPIHIVLGYDITRVDDLVSGYQRTVSLGAAIAGLALLFVMVWTRRLMLDQIGRTDTLLASVEDSRRRMQLALETTEQGIWEWLPTTGDMYISDHWRDLLGFGQQGDPVMFDAWFNRLHPDDRSRVCLLYTSPSPRD